MASTAQQGASDQRIEALQRKHAGLEESLRVEMSRPLPDSAEVQRLKKQKLRIKQQMARS